MTYTSHGHHIPGSPTNDEVSQPKVARCGGPSLCKLCQREAAQWRAEAISGPDLTPDGIATQVADIRANNDRFVESAGREASLAAGLMPSSQSNMIEDAAFKMQQAQYHMLMAIHGELRMANIIALSKGIR